MAVYSMTGYASVTRAAAAGTASAADAGTSAAGPTPLFLQTGTSVELRSVNSRFLDLVLRLPDDLRSLEPTLRELLTQAFRRGKIELRVTVQRDDDDAAWPQPQPAQLNRLARIEDAVRTWLPDAAGLSVHEVLHWCKSAAVADARPDEAALDATREAIAGLRAAREREGARLADVLTERVARLRELADQAEPLVPAVVERQRRRFVERWNEALQAAGAAQGVPAAAAHERALGEAAAHAVRIDVAEELARLRSHLDEIARLLRKGGEVGKRLDFLIQELLREANTLGSKSAALELTAIAVEMKVAIEQLREQVQNIE
jgi:uncharacterized protein (TIGR00255 family)